MPAEPVCPITASTQLQRLPRLLLADEHQVVMDSLKQSLSDEYNVLTVDSGEAFLDELDRFDPDVAILEIMPFVDIFSVVKRALKFNPSLGVIFLSMHSESDGPLRAAEAGAKAYVSKTAPLNDLRASIRAVLAGEDLLTEIKKNPAPVGSAQTGLTTRQREVLRLIAHGFSAKEVANTLTISVRTAEFHRADIMKRLKIKTTALLTRYAITHNLV